VTFDQDVAALAVFPFVGDPDLVGLRRALPTSGFPDMGVTVPTMITGHPNIFATRASRTLFHHRVRWRNRYEDFCGAGCEAQPGGQKECGTKSTHMAYDRMLCLGSETPIAVALEWRNWQTHGTQNPATFTGHVGSTPTSSTNKKQQIDEGSRAVRPPC
jgi:hypothetical protein